MHREAEGGLQNSAGKTRVEIGSNELYGDRPIVCTSFPTIDLSNFGTFKCQYRVGVGSSCIVLKMRLRLINYAYVDFCRTEFTVH